MLRRGLSEHLIGLPSGGASVMYTARMAGPQRLGSSKATSSVRPLPCYLPPRLAVQVQGAQGHSTSTAATGITTVTKDTATPMPTSKPRLSPSVSTPNSRSASTTSSNPTALPADAIPLCLADGAVLSDSRGVLLDRLPSTAIASKDVSNLDHGALVLGLTSSEGPTSMTDITLGKLKVGRMLACARCKLWWMTPEWRSSTLQLPPETQFLLTELQGSGAEEEPAYALLLPLIDSDFRVTLRAGRVNSEEGHVTIRIESGDKRVKRESWNNILYMATGTDPFLLIERGVAAAARLSGGALPRSQKQLPPSLDVFGWCTWDAFYSTVSARGIAEGLRSLQSGGIRPRTLIIDDGWQTTDVDADFRKAPTSELAEQLHLRQPEQQLVESMENVFYDGSMEMLAETAGHLSAGTSSGTVMPGLSNLGPEGVRHHHHLPTPFPSATGSVASAGSISTLSSLPSASSLGTLASVSSMDPLPASAPEAPASSSAAAQPTAAESAAAGPAAATGPSADTVVAVRMAQRVAGWLTGLGTAAFLMLYQTVVEPAAAGSWPVQIFSKLAAGPLRPLLLAFYANASDFTRRLTSVRANGKFSHPDAGPEDEWLVQEERLADVVASLKQQFGLDFVYCWHGLPAYWAGVMPDSVDLRQHQSEIMYAEPTPGVLEVEPSMAWNPAVLAGVGVIQDPSQLYNEMHSYLRSSGVDGVKVDCQAGVGLVGSALGGGAALSRRFHTALEESVMTNFSGNHCINCMCHSTENLYRMTHTSVARASDDFYPRDAASSHPHIAACAFNGLFLSALVLPDWDMFHSKHSSAELHGMARAISGSAVYVSDKPGEHDFELLRRLVLPDGSILRALQPARPTRDSLFNDVLRDSKSVLKVWTVNSYCGVVGLFNLQGSSWDRDRRKFFVHDSNPKALSTKVYARDVEQQQQQHEGGPCASPQQEQQQQQRYVLYSYSGQALRVMESSQGMDVRLPGAQAEMVTVSPLLEAAGTSFAPLGLCEMFNGGGAVRSCSLRLPSDNAKGSNGSGNGVPAASGPSFVVSVHGCGRFLAYCSQAPVAVSTDHLTLFHSYDAVTGALHVEVPATQDLSCQLEFKFCASHESG